MLNLNLPHFPVLTTERLILRRLVEHDAPRIHQLRSDPEVNRYLGRPSSTGIDDAMAFIKKIDHNIALQNSLYWVLNFKGSDNLIGTICLWNFDHEHDTAELGYELMPQHQGKGLMTEAVNTVITYAIAELRARGIIACLSADNLPSVTLLKKMGFEIDDALMADASIQTEGLIAFRLSKKDGDN